MSFGKRSGPQKKKGPPRGGFRAQTRDLFVPHDVVKVARDPELKHLDVNSSGYISGVSYAGTITALSAIAQGVAGNQRVGDAAMVRGIDFRAAAYSQGSSQFLRMIVFQWNLDTSIGAPTAGQVLQGVGATAQTIACPYDFTSAEQGRLNIIADFVLEAASSATTPALKVVQKEGRWQVNFTAGSTTAQGQIYVLAISDAALAGNAPVYQWWSRIMYDDL